MVLRISSTVASIFETRKTLEKSITRELLLFVKRKRGGEAKLIRLSLFGVAATKYAKNRVFV